jgi:hypothetical protein
MPAILPSIPHSLLAYPMPLQPLAAKLTHRARLYEYSSSIFWLIQSTTELHPQHVSFQITVHHTKNNSPQHNQSIRNQIRNPHIKRRQHRARNHILQHQHRNTPCHPPRQTRKPKEQHHSRLPRNARSRVRERVCRETSLLNGVYDQHSERGEYEGEPVDEVDVYGGVGAVLRGVRPDCSIEHDIEGEGELWFCCQHHGFEMVVGLSLGEAQRGRRGSSPAQPRSSISLPQTQPHSSFRSLSSKE